MKVLTFEDIDSLKERGYFSSSVDTRYNSDFECLQKLSVYNIQPTPYLYLLRDMNNQTILNLKKFICLKWNNVASSLDDITINFKENTIPQICTFFLNTDKDKNHRVYFFIEMIHQYFFP